MREKGIKIGYGIFPFGFFYEEWIIRNEYIKPFIVFNYKSDVEEWKKLNCKSSWIIKSIYYIPSDTVFTENTLIPPFKGIKLADAIFLKNEFLENYERIDPNICCFF